MAAKKHRISISADECKGCRRCIPACPKKLISVGNAINIQGYVAVKADHPEDCIGCGSCFHQCPEPGAITIYVEE
ncbi:MAG: 4Fe-4S dicluster domain-containing protein [Victivallaceae bacterium]|nr:4Fe-4S dicluster domain-containing protein [Victivallaceae bacterium]